MIRPTMKYVGLLSLGFCLLGCGSKGTVSLSAFIETLDVGARQGALGSELTGSFTLYLSLGDEAPNSTQVSLGNFTLARDTTAIRDPLKADPVDVSFPVTLGKGAELRVPFEIKESKLLTAAERDTLCQGPVVVRGAVSDTLSGGKTTPIESNSATPKCE